MKITINRNKQKGKQNGVTLLLTILVLSAITAISFSLASVVFTEIRTSGDLQRTEPALYATQGVIEQSIFKVQRDIPDAQMCFDSSDPSKLIPTGTATQTSCNNNTHIKSNINLVTIAAVGTQDIGDSPISEIVPPEYNALSNTKNVYSIYDAVNPNNPTWGYTRLKLENPPGGTLIYYSFCVINEPNVTEPIDCSPTSTYPHVSWWNRDTALSPGTSFTTDLQKTQMYKLYVYRPISVTTPGYINIYSYGPSSSTDTCTGGGAVGECQGKGLPLKGKKQVDVTATNAGLTRRYRVLIPLSR